MVRRTTDALYGRIGFYGEKSEHYVEAYNVGDDTKAGIVLKYLHASIDTKAVNDTSAHLSYVVKDIHDTLDEEGIPSRYLSLVGDKVTSVKLSLPFENAGIEKGDVIKYDYLQGVMYKLHNMFGADDYLTRFADPDSRLIESEPADDADIGRLRASRTIYGTIMDINEDMIFHTTTVPNDNVDMSSRVNLANFTGYKKAGNVYIYDKNSRTGNVEVGTMDDIITYKINPDKPDKVVIGMANGTINYIYVLRGWE